MILGARKKERKDSKTTGLFLLNTPTSRGRPPPYKWRLTLSGRVIWLAFVAFVNQPLASCLPVWARFIVHVFSAINYTTLWSKLTDKSSNSCFLKRSLSEHLLQNEPITVVRERGDTTYIDL